MIKKLNKKDFDLVNEIVNFVFVKQNNFNYVFEYFPNDFYNIRQYIKNNTVLYNDENGINFILIKDKEEVNFLYFNDVKYLKECLSEINGLQLVVNSNNVLLNDIKTLNITYTESKVLQLSLTNKDIKKLQDSKYLIIPLQKHLLEEYLEIHSENVYDKCYTMVCIKNNELIGYIDFDDEEIIEISSTLKDKILTTYLYKQLFLKYLEVTRQNKLIYQTDQDLAREELESMGFEVIEENVNFEF